MAATERVGIEIELMGGEEALALLKRIDGQIDTLNKRKKFRSLSGLKSAKGELEGYITELNKLEQKAESTRKAMDKWGEPFKKSAAGQRLSKELEASEQRAEAVRSKIKQMSADMTEVTTRTKTFVQVWKSASSTVAHVGSAMQSLGNAMVRLTSPFRRITSGLLLGAGYKVLNLFTEGMSGAFGRSDTMTKYTKLMREYEKANYSAEQSRNELDASIQGLPIALDEAVGLAQRYTLSVGDMERGTKLAIATNNAFLASMATESQRYQGMLQLQDLMNGKQLTGREWMSLGSSMGKAINEVGLQLGYDKDQLGEFRQELYAGKIASEDFLDALIEVGTGSGSLVALARTSAETWEGFFSNARIAVARMGANVIDTLNKTFEKATGRTLLQQLLGIDANGNDMGDGVKHWIDDLSKSVQNWIQSHPDEIIGFFNDLKSIDWKGLARGFAEGAMEIARLIGAFAKWASGKDLSKIGKWLPRLNIFGNGLLVLGGFLKGTRHIWGLLGTLAFGKFQGKGGLFGKIASLFGKKKDIAAAGEAAKEIPTVASTFKGAFSALQGLIQAAGAVVIVSGTGFVAFKAAKSILKDLKEMTDLVNGGGWDNVGYVGSGVVLAIGTFTEIFNAIGTALGPQGLLGTAIAGAASFIVAGSFAADMWAIKQGVIQIRDTIAELDNIATEITNFKGIGSLGAGVKQKFMDSINAINEIKDLLVGKSGSPMDRGQVSAGIPMFTSFRTNSLTNIASALKQMESIATQLNALSAMTVNDPTATIEAIKKALNTLQGIRGPKNIDAHAEAVANALYQIRRMAYSINKLAGTDVNAGGFASFVAQLKAALESLKGLQGTLELDIAVKLSPNFGKSVNTVIKYINKAKQNIKNSTNKAVVFSIPVKVTFTLSTNYGSILAGIISRKASLKSAASSGTDFIGPPVHPAKGGMIYRSRGGGVPWKRRGTDTVPAMLTPGEYVHNKRAVNTFGIDFMRKVNNLDIKGAMNELMHRAGGMANINRGSVVNNTYNNQKVVINNNGNSGADYTFKRASRFVGAI